MMIETNFLSSSNVMDLLIVSIVKWAIPRFPKVCKPTVHFPVHLRVGFQKTSDQLISRRREEFAKIMDVAKGLFQSTLHGFRF